MLIITRRLRQAFIAVGVVAASSLMLSGTAYAYGGNGAASYADNYAMNPNGAYQVYGDDCTNFVSQSMYLGGNHHLVGTPSPSVINNNAQWWIWGNGSGRTFSWSVADNLASFLTITNPGGVWMGSQTGTQAAYTPSGVVSGDVIFYTWDYRTTTAKNHASIQVGIGTDIASGWYGNLIDQHTTNRRHAIWNLVPYNSQWQYTYTAEYHIPSNA